jgi:hypothetical protein
MFKSKSILPSLPGILASSSLLATDLPEKSTVLILQINNQNGGVASYLHMLAPLQPAGQPQLHCQGRRHLPPRRRSRLQNEQIRTSCRQPRAPKRTDCRPHLAAQARLRCVHHRSRSSHPWRTSPASTMGWYRRRRLNWNAPCSHSELQISNSMCGMWRFHLIF